MTRRSLWNRVDAALERGKFVVVAVVLVAAAAWFVFDPLGDGARLPGAPATSTTDPDEFDATTATDEEIFAECRSAVRDLPEYDREGALYACLDLYFDRADRARPRGWPASDAPAWPEPLGRATDPTLESTGPADGSSSRDYSPSHPRAAMHNGMKPPIMRANAV